MRTTIVLDDHLTKQFKAAARQRGLSLSAFLAEAGRASLNQKRATARRFKLITFAGDGLATEQDLNQANRLLTLDDLNWRAFCS
jgi:hypothetical protein